MDQIIAAASAAFFITLWLPWFGTGSFSEGGINAHSYLAFALLTSVAMMVYLAARAGWDRLPVRLPVAHAPLLLVLGGVQLVIVVIAFLSTPTYLSHDAGAWLALIAALAASLPIVALMVGASQQR